MKKINYPLPWIRGVSESVPWAEAVTSGALLGRLVTPNHGLVPGILLLLLLAPGWPGLLITPKIFWLWLWHHWSRGHGTVAYPRRIIHKGESRTLSGLRLLAEYYTFSNSHWHASNPGGIHKYWVRNRQTNEVSYQDYYRKESQKKVLGNTVIK